MLRLRYILLVVALMAGGYAWSQNPDNRESIGQEKHSSAEKKQLSNFDTSSLEKTIRESIKEASEKDNTHTDEKLESDRKLVEYTEQLAFFTKGLVFATMILAGIAIWQGWHLKRTVDSQERVERAILFIGKLEPRIFPTDADTLLYGSNQETPWPRIGYSFTNLGRTTAVINKIEVKLILEDKLQRLTPASYKDGDAMDGERVLASSDTTEIYPCTLKRHLTKEEIKLVRNGTKKIYIFGFAKYEDIFEYEHVYNFCFQFLPESNGVVAMGGEEYNFRPTQKKKYGIVK